MKGKKVFDCFRCETIVKRVTLPRGNRDAKFMVVGDAPGVGDGAKKTIDRAWSYGPSSKMLVKALTMVGILDDCWFTNVLKCACPMNRPSSELEQRNCRKYLNAEMKAINPQFVILLGKHVQKTFVREEGARYIEIAHPAFYVRSGKRADAYARHIKEMIGECE